jgi:predicted CopG family antitoxin
VKSLVSSKPLKQIAVSPENYLVLKSLGSAGDSFNDVITGVLKKITKQQETVIGNG